MTLRTLFSWIPLAILALVFYVGCPSEDQDDDDNDSAATDDDVADDDAADDDAADDDAADDDAADDDAADDDAADDDTSAGVPNIVVTPPSLNFGVVNVGSTETLPLEIVNNGDGALEIIEMVCPLAEIAFNPFTGFIPPGGNETLAIDATCTVENEYYGNLTIVSNDPDENMIQIQVILVCDEA